MMFNASEYQRYARHFSLHGFGTSGQQKLKNAKIFCIGCGGLAASAITYLAASGVGLIGIMDNDVVDESNLQRQVLFNTNDIGTKKVVVAKRRINELNPHVQINIYSTMLDDDNALNIIKEYDLIIDCTDNFYAKYLINDACFELKKPFVYGSIFQFEGQVSFFSGTDGPCFRCLFSSPPQPGMVANCAEEGVLGVLPGLIGTLQAIEAIKYIVGIGDNLLGKLFFFDTLKMQATPLGFGVSKECPICVEKKDFHTLTRPNTKNCSINEDVVKQISPQELKPIINAVTLIDVREEYEQQICNIGGKLIPLTSFSAAVSTIPQDKPIVLYCKVGVRSYAAAQLLIDRGFTNVFSLEGGIRAWIEQIDPTLARY